MFNTLAITNFVSESFFAVHGLNFFLVNLFIGLNVSSRVFL